MFVAYSKFIFSMNIIFFQIMDHEAFELKIYHLSYDGNLLDAFKIADCSSLRDVYEHMNLVMTLFTVSGSVPHVFSLLSSFSFLFSFNLL